MQRSFKVTACWDPDEKVYYSESDIKGLHIETATLKEFEEILFDIGPELIITNHVNVKDITSLALRDFVPGIIWQPPAEPELACA